MTTEELVDELTARFTGWSTDGPQGVLPYLSQAQDLLMACESHQTLAFDENGDMLTLETEAGKKLYSLPDNIWRVSGVMLPVLRGHHGLRGAPITIGGVDYWAVKLLRTQDYVSHDNPAKVIFSEDPKGLAFVLRAYVRPKPLTSTRVAHVIPQPLDGAYLLPATAMLIDGVQNGNAVEARRVIEKELKPEFWAQMNKGEQSENIEPVRRGF
ncbi:MAG: hypothetical protein FWB85_01175 [Chitinispirillia bacterium]|nr:hypothetical protein [Chitinispirillia bacterium]MCL2241271.1 hypothetical protein [Chitinispirillia bacterium]